VLLRRINIHQDFAIAVTAVGFEVRDAAWDIDIAHCGHYPLRMPMFDWSRSGFTAITATNLHGMVEGFGKSPPTAATRGQDFSHCRSPSFAKESAAPCCERRREKSADHSGAK
jgi:hypothetical protein